MWGLADCNNFFVSCERTVNPSLIGKAVVVLSNNDGCVVARSNEAKQMGIRMGQPAFEIRDLISSGRLIALSGNHLLYRKVSLQVHSIIARYVPSTIDYSVDESFLDMRGLPQSSLAAIGRDIVERCAMEARVPVTVGIAPTKTLCKIAADLGKKSGCPVMTLTDKAEIDRRLGELDVADVWGIGRRLARKLYARGIYTAKALASLHRLRVRSLLGVNGEKTWLELHSTPCIDLGHVGRELQDSISETRTFPADENDYDYLRSRIIIYAGDCSRRLRGMRGRCSAITVFLRTNRFHPELGVDCPSATVCLPLPSNDTNVIVNGAISALDRIYTPKFSYKRAGVILSDISAAGIYTPSLFEDRDQAVKTLRSSSHPALMKAIDRINSITGLPHVRLASQLVAGQPGHNDGYSSSFGAPGKNR